MSASSLRTRRHVLAAGGAVLGGLLPARGARAQSVSSSSHSSSYTSASSHGGSSEMTGGWDWGWWGKHHHHHHHDHPTCFLAGTAIDTDDGPRAVETLRAGEGIVTASGEVLPVRRITVSHYGRGSDGSWSRHVHPVLIRAGALGPGTPARDLYVSPGHAMLVDGYFMLARDLVNGSSIVPAVPAGTEAVSYRHVELERHAIIFAEGCATESLFVPALHAQTAAPAIRYDGARANLAALVRLGTSRLLDRRDPLQRAYGRLAARANAGAFAGAAG